MNEISIFILNLTIFESIIFNNFLSLWVIHLCVDLAIVFNYVTENTLFSLYNNYGIHIYIFWIFSLLFCDTRIDTKPVEEKNPEEESDSRVPSNQNERTVCAFIRSKTYTFLQIIIAIGHICVGCSTIRYNIFHIFNNNNLQKNNVIILLILICAVNILAPLVTKLKLKTKVWLMLFLIMLNFFVSIFLKFVNANETVSYYAFLIDILMKKFLTICKCCMSSIILQDSNDVEYKDNKCLFLKFFILNSDSISYILNKSIQNYVDIDFVNVPVIIMIMLLYKLYVSLSCIHL